MSILKSLDLSSDDFNEKGVYRHKSNFGYVDFVKLSETLNLADEIYSIHRDIWNKNESEVFVLILNDRKIILCDSKTKPTEFSTLDNIKINSFEYGENSPEAIKYMDLLKRENIDNGYFWEEISKKLRQRGKKRTPIDKDLLTNLIDIRKNIIKILSINTCCNPSNVAQKLIDRCLYIRFIEDRMGYTKLLDIFEKSDETRFSDLFNLFACYNKTLNGDIFDSNQIDTESEEAIDLLKRVFGKFYKYSDGQTTLVPYKFDKIPIILISNIYQEFLSGEKRNSEGMVFTPENIADFMVDSVFQEQNILRKAQNGTLKILDSACGSGVFLVKSFKKILFEREKYLNKTLSLTEKRQLLQKCIYGIDLDGNAIRVAAFSLYIEIFESVDTDLIRQEVFDKHKHGTTHFMFPGLNGTNLIEANSLFDENIFDFKFDLIIGNPPWGYKFDAEEKKQLTKKRKFVSDHQSSQHFLFQTKEWMKAGTLAFMIVNITNFTNKKATKFRDEFLNEYTLTKFINISKLDAFDEPACILYFKQKNKEENDIEFIIPENNKFTELTNKLIIRETDRNWIPYEKITDDLSGDRYWRIGTLGYATYINLIDKIEHDKASLGEYAIVKMGLTPYSKKKHGSTKEARKIFESETCKGDHWYPYIDSAKLVKPFFISEKHHYINHIPDELERARPIELFQGKKLIIERIGSNGAAAFTEKFMIFSGAFIILKTKEDVPHIYYDLFEAIINSALGSFYLDILYKHREKGNYPRFNLESLLSIPIPDIEGKSQLVTEIIKKIDEIRIGKNVEDLKEHLNNLIFSFYDLDYYEKMQIMDYQNIKKRKGNNLVHANDFKEYVESFQKSFAFMLEDGCELNADCFESDFLGALVRFNISNEKLETKCNMSTSLKQLNQIIQNDYLQQIDEADILEEKNMKFYSENSLIVYKSNRLKDWTRVEALNDVKQEIAEIYNQLIC